MRDPASTALLLDAAALEPSCLATLDALLMERARLGRRTHVASGLLEAIESCETLAPSSAWTLWTDMQPVDRRDPHALFGQRDASDPAALLCALIQDGALVHAPQVVRPEPSLLGRLHGQAAACHLLVITASRDEAQLERWLSSAGTEESQAWACRDASLAARSGGRSIRMRCGMGPDLPAAGAACLHHAGPEPVIRGALPRRFAPHEPLWASPSEAFAASFGLPCVREGRALHGLDLLAQEPRVTISADADLVMPELARAWTVMHRLRVEPSALIAAGACPRLEYQVVSGAEVLHLEHVRVQETLQRLSVCIEHPDPRFDGLFEGWPVTADAWRVHFGCERIQVERMASMRRSAAAWLSDASGRNPSSVPGFAPEVCLRLLRRAILPEIAQAVRFPAGGHGEGHAWIVAHLALLLAIEEDAPPLAPALAGALHDTGRLGDETDHDHPLRGAAIARRVLPALRSAALPPEACAAVECAIASHSDQTPASCRVAALLRDADRLGLAWERGYRHRHFATPAGQRLAAAGPAAAERAFRARFGACLFDTVGFSASDVAP